MPSPGTRNAVCRARSRISSRWNVAPFVKICGSAQYRMRVPVTFLPTLPTTRSSLPDTKGANGASGVGFAGSASVNTPGSPRWNDIAQVLPSRSTSTSSRSLRALTTDAPTPCSPPDAAYDPLPNLPPAWSFVNTTSTPDSPVLGSMSTGMPRAVSRTSTLSSSCRITSMSLPCPASASSTELSMISQRQCMSPRESVDPTYMPGSLAHRLESLEHAEVSGGVCGRLASALATIVVLLSVVRGNRGNVGRQTTVKTNEHPRRPP